MTDPAPTVYTYEVRHDGIPVARVQGTAVDVDSTGTLVVWHGEDAVGIYPAHTHSATRMAPLPTAPGVAELVAALSDEGVAYLARRVQRTIQMEARA